MKIKFLLMILILNFPYKIFSQVSTDAKSIFKMWLFLDKMNVYQRNPKTTIKDDSLFSLFENVTDFKLDTLQSKGFDRIGYQFYLLHLNNLKILKDLNEDEAQSLLIFTGKFDSVIIGLNSKTGKSYRLLGFNGNDFLSFLIDITENNSINNEGISQKKFFNEFKVEKLDFNCLNKALKDKNLDRRKYPCLIRYSDPIITH